MSRAPAASSWSISASTRIRPTAVFAGGYNTFAARTRRTSPRPASWRASWRHTSSGPMSGSRRRDADLAAGGESEQVGVMAGGGGGVAVRVRHAPGRGEHAAGGDRQAAIRHQRERALHLVLGGVAEAAIGERL